MDERATETTDELRAELDRAERTRLIARCIAAHRAWLDRRLDRSL
jgi:hypothetical protein